jgi:hypothetical protein
MEMRSAFETIYEHDLWTHSSGPGSILQFNLPYMKFLESFITANSIRSISDIGCGDFQFMNQVDFAGAVYDGYDLVSSVITAAQALHGSGNVRFHIMPDDPNELDGGDLAIVKDVLIHLDNAHAQQLIDALIVKFQFVLVVNNVAKDPSSYNMEIEPGKFRPVDVSLPPFNYPCATVLRYSQDRAYDPHYYWVVAKLRRKYVWPGRKHVQLIISESPKPG